MVGMVTDLVFDPFIECQSFIFKLRDNIMWKIYDQNNAYVLENEYQRFIFSGLRKHTKLCLFLQSCEDDPDLWNAFDEYERAAGTK
jgi:hypothetical protein